MSNTQSWIPWKSIGFTEEELAHMKANPIKSTCGVCKRDTTGIPPLSDAFSCDTSSCPSKCW